MFSEESCSLQSSAISSFLPHIFAPSIPKGAPLIYAIEFNRDKTKNIL